MIRLAHAAVLLFATSVAVAACSPEREILSSLEKDGGPPEPQPEKPDSQAPPSPIACKGHETCPLGQLCVETSGPEGLVCKPCADVDTAAACKACPSDSTQVSDKINGCAVCTCGPASSCFADTECAEGEHCYQGQTCYPGCTGSPKCCQGNLCGSPGCTDTTGLDCNLVGCPSGQVCNANCPPPKCFCDVKLKQWKCEGGCKATCVFPK